MKVIIRILILIFSLNLFSQLELKLEKNYGEKVVRCEPIWVKVILENKSNRKVIIGVEGAVSLTLIKSFYFLVNGREYRGPWSDGHEVIEFPANAKNYIDKGESKESNIDLRIMALQEGKYDLEAVLELEEKVYKSNKIELDIEAPVGIDEEAYRYAEEEYNRLMGDYWNRENKPYNIRFMGVCKYLTENPTFTLENFPISTYAGWALKDYVYKTFDYDEEGRKNEKRKYRDLIETFVNANNDFISAGSLLSKAAFISLELGEINKACELFDKSLKLKWEFLAMNKKFKEKEINRSKSVYEKLKKEGKCK